MSRRAARPLGFAERIVRGASVGGVTVRSLTDDWGDVIGRTASGESVTIEGSLALPAAFKAIRLFSEAGGALPAITYRRDGEEKARDTTHRSYGLLHEEPNDYLTAVEFWTMLFAHLSGWGKVLIGKEFRGSRVDKLHAIHPRDVTVERLRSGKLRFREQRSEPPFREVVWKAEDLIYVRLFTLDGVTGLSPIGLQRETMGLALAMRKHAGHFFRDSAIPSGALRVPNEIKDPLVRERMRQEWDDRHRGKRGTAILDAGAEFQGITMSYKDAQFVELAQMSRLDIADAFNMPPSLLGAPTGGSNTYGNRESDMQQFLTFSLHNPLRKVEQALSNDADLFGSGRTHFTEFLRDELLRPDSPRRAAFYRQALDEKTGWMRREEVRRRENLPAEPDPPSQEADDE